MRSRLHSVRAQMLSVRLALAMPWAGGGRCVWGGGGKGDDGKEQGGGVVAVCAGWWQVEVCVGGHRGVRGVAEEEGCIATVCRVEAAGRCSDSGQESRGHGASGS
jgi:hypothetical protein